MKLLNVIANTKAILIIAIIGMIGHSIFYVLGDDNAKRHLLCWMMCTIFILSCRIAINGSVKAK